MLQIGQKENTQSGQRRAVKGIIKLLLTKSERYIIGILVIEKENRPQNAAKWIVQRNAGTWILEVLQIDYKNAAKHIIKESKDHTLHPQSCISYYLCIKSDHKK